MLLYCAVLIPLGVLVAIGTHLIVEAPLLSRMRDTHSPFLAFRRPRTISVVESESVDGAGVEGDTDRSLDMIPVLRGGALCVMQRRAPAYTSSGGIGDPAARSFRFPSESAAAATPVFLRDGGTESEGAAAESRGARPTQPVAFVTPGDDPDDTEDDSEGESGSGSDSTESGSGSEGAQVRRGEHESGDSDNDASEGSSIDTDDDGSDLMSDTELDELTRVADDIIAETNGQVSSSAISDSVTLAQSLRSCRLNKT